MTHGYVLLFSFSPRFQYTFRYRRLTFWEISIGLNFTLTRIDETSDIWPWKWEVDLYTSSRLIHGKYDTSLLNYLNQAEIDTSLTIM